MKVRGRHVVLAAVLVTVALLGLVVLLAVRGDGGGDGETGGPGEALVNGKKAIEQMSRKELEGYARELELKLKWHQRYREEEAHVAAVLQDSVKAELLEQEGALSKCRKKVKRAEERSLGDGNPGVAWATAATRDLLLPEMIAEEEWELLRLQERRTQLDSALKLSLPLPKPYFFVHLAKTGGTSLISSVTSALPYLNSLHFWRTPNEEDAMAAIAPYLSSASVQDGGRRLEALMGHVSYGAHKWWPDEEPLAKYSYFTLLRNPVQRVVSHYRYHLTNVADPHHKDALGRTLSQWVKDMKFGQNAMTAFLSGYQHSDWWNAGDPEAPLMRAAVVLPADEFRPSDGLQWPGDAEERGSNCTALRDENYRVTYSHYKKARRNLFTMLVGLQEEYDESIDHFNRWLEFGNGLSSSHQNMNSKGHPVDISQDDLDTIYRYNEWDVRIYRLATVLFEQQRDIIGQNKSN